MKTIIFSILVSGLMFLNLSNSFSCDPPQLIFSTCNGGNVILNFQTTASPSLLGFNFYRNGEFLEYQPHTGDTVYSHYFIYQPPGTHTYCITAVCDTMYMESRNDTVESEPDCVTLDCYYGFDLPFEENWDLGSFSANEWEISSDAWMISADTGNIPLAALFEPEIPLTDYSESLESYYLKAYGMTEGHIFLEYDLSVSAADSSGTEHLLVQVWDHQTEEYHTVKDYTNQNGSFGWTRDTLNIKPNAMGKIFRIRFVTQGVNSSYINYWGIDNINVYRKCDPPPYQMESYLLNDTCIFLYTVENKVRDLVDLLIYVTKDDETIAVYSGSDPYNQIPNPYCVNESGEYCFYMTALWMSESDECESELTEPTCQQVIINSMDDKSISLISIFYNPNYKILRVESQESIDQIEIYDFAGRYVDSASPGSTFVQKDLSYLKPGLYLVRISSSTHSVTGKIIIN